MDPKREITLTLSWQTVQIISAALQELPFRVANPVLADLQRQIDAQIGDNVVPMPTQEEKSA